MIKAPISKIEYITLLERRKSLNHRRVRIDVELLRLRVRYRLIRNSDS